MSIKKTRGKKYQVVSFVGARPQFVKLAPLARRLAESAAHTKIVHRIIHSGQHYDPKLSKVFFDRLSIPEPNENLRVGSGSHGAMTGAILARFEKSLVKQRPDLVVVYGDTNTTLSGALAAVKLGIPVAHVEAGLRSFDLSMPEEVNRRVTDHLSALLLCPTTESVKNARREHVSGKIVRVGDLMYELLHSFRDHIPQNNALLKRCRIIAGEYVVLTAHRPATVDSKDSLKALLALIKLLKRPVVFPVHPRTRSSLKRHRLLGALRAIKNVRLVDPLPYIDLLTLVTQASAVVTDSGGLQKETVFLGTKCLTLRDITEWPETLRYGNHLVDLSQKKMRQALAAPHKARRIPWKVNGKAPSELIIQSLTSLLRG